MGQELKVGIVVAEARTAGDIGPAYEVLAAERVQVVVVEQSNMLIAAREQIAEAAAAKKITFSLWVPRARRGGRPNQLRRRFELVLPSRGLLRR